MSRRDDDEEKSRATSRKSSLMHDYTENEGDLVLLEESPVSAGQEEMSLMERLRTRFSISHQLYRETVAEFFCTAVLLFGGTSTVAQFVLSNRQTDEWVCVAMGWGIALWLAVQMGIRISGAHLNPAVSFFLLTQRKIDLTKFLIFVAAQNLGAFVGALGTFIVYYDAAVTAWLLALLPLSHYFIDARQDANGINAYDNGTRQVTGPQATAGIFATYPKPYLSVLGGFLDQVFGTAMLCLGVATIVDKRNGIPQFLQPAYICLLLTGIGITWAQNSGYAINPARDFGPRLFTLCAGYGTEVFSYRDYSWFWIPIVAPMVGAVIGAWIYDFVIGFNLPGDPDTYYLFKVHDNDAPIHHTKNTLEDVEQRLGSLPIEDTQE